MKDVEKAEDTERTDMVVCPHCGHEMEPSDVDAYIGEDEEEELECGNCDKKFLLSAHCSYTFTTKRLPCDDNMHQYVLMERVAGENPYIYSDKVWTIYQCTECHEELVKTAPIPADGKPYVIPLNEVEV
jgi:DNA-directed RNA polymerase subunit RPC12/RpoP